MKKIATILFMLFISISVFSQVNIFSINSGGNLNSSVGILSASSNTDIIAIINADNTISIENVFSETNISIYPNPTVDYININSDYDVNYNLFDISGKMILSGVNKQIDVSYLKNGIYLLTINGDNFKVIKQ